MSKNISAFKVAIVATEKAIAVKTKKLEQIKADWNLYVDHDALHAQIMKVNYDFGYQDELAKQSKGQKKINAQKSAAELKKEDKRLRGLDGQKLIDDEMNLENEIEVLTSELRALKNLSDRNPRFIM